MKHAGALHDKNSFNTAVFVAVIGRHGQHPPQSLIGYGLEVESLIGKGLEVGGFRGCML